MRVVLIFFRPVKVMCYGLAISMAISINEVSRCGSV